MILNFLLGLVGGLIGGPLGLVLIQAWSTFTNEEDGEPQTRN